MQGIYSVHVPLNVWSNCIVGSLKWVQSRFDRDAPSLEEVTYLPTSFFSGSLASILNPFGCDGFMGIFICEGVLYFITSCLFVCLDCQTCHICDVSGENFISATHSFQLTCTCNNTLNTEILLELFGLIYSYLLPVALCI